MSDITAFIDKNLKRTIHNNTKDEGTLLGLPYPYTVPCADDKFLEMYYWDTYFTNVGLLIHGMAEQAKCNVDDILYLVNKYGFMPNGNRTYYLNRSQPPFLYAMVRDIYEYFGDMNWLKGAYETLKKEYNFWQTARRAENGLNFYGNKENITSEQINWLNNDFKKRSGGFETKDNKLRENIAHTVMTFVESGWDCNSRFELDGLHYNPVDLNSLLYGFELEMAYFSGVLGAGEEDFWKTCAAKRKDIMKTYMWNEKYGIYMDWNFKEKRFSPIRSAASLYPLYVKLSDDISGEEKLLKELTLPYGVSASLAENCKYSLQWDYPNIWPPLQYIAFIGTNNYGLDENSKMIAQKYVSLIEKSFSETGNLWEKYDGNNGTVASQDYDAPAMMGWTGGVYLFFKKYLGQ